MNEATRRFPPIALFLFATMVALPLYGFSDPGIVAAEWRPIGLQGIDVLSLSGAPGRLCAGTRGKGVFCLDWTAARLGWRPLGPAGTTILGLWVDPLRPDVMFAAAEAPAGTIRLFRSLDGGGTWESIGSNVPPDPGVHALWRVHGVPGTRTVYASGGAVWRSDDLGNTWRNVLPQAYQSSLEVAPTDPRTIWSGGDLAFAFAPESIVWLSRDGGETWSDVFAAGPFDYSPLRDLSAHLYRDGVVLAGFYGYVIRTTDHGASFQKVLRSPVYFLVDWGAGGPGGLAIAAGPYGGTTVGSEAYASRDLGETWAPITGTSLARLTIRDLEADDRLAGLAFAATNDGVYAFFGAGFPICHDARQGVDAAILWPGDCPPILSPGPVILGDVIVADRAALHAEADHVDLGAVRCVVEDADIAFTTLDLPDPPVGGIYLILAREDGPADYGKSSDGLPRVPSLGDCR